MGLDRRVPFIRLLCLSGDVDALIDVADFEHLILENDLLPSQELDVTLILPSGARSTTIVVFSPVANRFRTFSGLP
jgi:hypothetical protein